VYTGPETKKKGKKEENKHLPFAVNNYVDYVALTSYP
jgi:hypothetical protein